ncbi:MAG: Wzz/FepE/Etk N-terminal domain-containing protein [Thermoflexales bacterium]|nr:Wzz/FepE/Etk N-terminal domain-containing protein [Thermoflexales bacterium]MCS7324159.1 Wzz/FepE/Etk N-terminal domain-containing protein [Thermoflexales bacterium]MCX7937823.1 Wzz/FepE/Etk N-terminal domain-containing protein [Thermoflexales bacterium]MDW8053236.1 Wzz/FepE/Etk N-terminal domain-containing protein [Anaerolineae bacterium]MDW8291887.1 Wzz/FepE/Etk N-terminal domain-containing protein [Anaerolineae bacterium]
MELQDYLDIARRRWWIVVLVSVVAAASAFVFSRLQTPIYKASMRLTIQPARTDFGLTQSAKTLLSSYINIIHTERNAAEIGKRLGLDYAPSYIFNQTRMADDAATFGIEIEVRDYDGETANRIAREWAQLFVEFRNNDNAKQRREDRVEAILGDAPRYVQDFPRTRVNTAAGGILGVVAGIAIVAALEWRDSRWVRSARDLERALSLPVLAIVQGHASPNARS